MDLDQDFWVLREHLFSCILVDGKVHLVGALIGEDMVGPCYGSLADSQGSAHLTPTVM
jgi:hypothetical protein